MVLPDMLTLEVVLLIELQALILLVRVERFLSQMAQIFAFLSNFGLPFLLSFEADR